MIADPPARPRRSSITDGRHRLAPGFHLIPADAGWLLYRPDGLFARLRIDPEIPALAAAWLAGETLPTGLETLDEFERFLHGMKSQGAILPVGDDDPAPDGRRRRVLLDGDGPVADQLRRVLEDAGLETRPAAEADQPLATSGESWAGLLVCCAGWLPDRLFTERDRWCAEAGVAWHGLYAEGGRFHLGPFWLPDDPRTARYADARARRLAADAHPDGLEAYWRYLDAGERVPDVVSANPAEAASVAGCLAADVLAWSRGLEPPSHGHQLAYDRDTGGWRRHPVLPVPRGLMTEGIP